MNKIAVYTYDSKGNEVFINKHLQEMDAFIKNAFGDEAKYDVFFDKTGINEDRADFTQLTDKIKNRQYTFLIRNGSNSPRSCRAARVQGLPWGSYH
jgi:hypothetical protein